MDISWDINKAMCFTGHRPDKIGGYDESHPLRRWVKEQLAKEIVLSIREGFNTFISGLAIGMDTDAAELIIDLRETYFPHIKLIAAIPFEGQEERWPYESRKRWANIVNESDEVHYVCEAGYAPWKLQRRNIWMVDRSSKIVSVWDGTSGGTANCVNYALGTGRDLIICRINPDDFQQHLNGER